MNILVFIKQVADTEARISIRSDKKSLEIENKYALNFFDEFAVEEAIRVKEKVKAGQITVCTLGGKKAVEALRTAIAMGTDRAFLIDDTGVAVDDPLVVSKILAGFAGQEKYDLILCGRQAIDDENGLIGPMVAELLGIPHASAITRLEATGDGPVEVDADVEGGKATIRLELPALVTAQKGLNTPRVPLITGVMKAMKVQIPVVDPVTLGVTRDEIDAGGTRTPLVAYDTKPERPAVKIIDGETPEAKARNLVRVLREEARAL